MKLSIEQANQVLNCGATVPHCDYTRECPNQGMPYYCGACTGTEYECDRNIDDAEDAAARQLEIDVDCYDQRTNTDCYR